MFHYSDSNDVPWSFIDLKSACHCSHTEMMCVLFSHGELFSRQAGDCITLAEKVSSSIIYTVWLRIDGAQNEGEFKMSLLL